MEKDLEAIVTLFHTHYPFQISGYLPKGQPCTLSLTLDLNFTAPLATSAPAPIFEHLTHPDHTVKLLFNIESSQEQSHSLLVQIKTTLSASAAQKGQTFETWLSRLQSHTVSDEHKQNAVGVLHSRLQDLRQHPNHPLLELSAIEQKWVNAYTKEEDNLLFEKAYTIMMKLLNTLAAVSTQENVASSCHTFSLIQETKEDGKLAKKLRDHHFYKKVMIGFLALCSQGMSSDIPEQGAEEGAGASIIRTELTTPENQKNFVKNTDTEDQSTKRGDTPHVSQEEIYEQEANQRIKELLEKVPTIEEKELLKMIKIETLKALDDLTEDEFNHHIKKYVCSLYNKGNIRDLRVDITWAKKQINKDKIAKIESLKLQKTYAEKRAEENEYLTNFYQNHVFSDLETNALGHILSGTLKKQS